MFTKLYDQVLSWSSHRLAPYYLALVSFLESVIFPIPPDVMLAPMSLVQPKRAYFFAFITTAMSVLGGVFGYLLGMFLWQGLEPWLLTLHYAEKAALAQQWFQDFGFWAVLIAGFSPIPYKVFTITAGAMGVFFPLFVLASFLGRGGRFFLVAFLMATFGVRFAPILRRFIEWIGWGLLLFLVLLYGWFYVL
jgi:membrane protein YqaA with SNARE-associated domain